MTEHSTDSCPRCGGEDLARGLELTKTAESGRIGLAYRAAGIFVGTEELLADLCLGCGTVVRFYVRETKRNWSSSAKR